MKVEMSKFAKTVMEDKYSQTKKNGDKETWEEIAHRVAKNVFGAISNVDPDLVAKVENLIKNRIFMPGGRYLYASGKVLHQTQNCVLLRAEDSREGWADLLYKSAMSLMTGAGMGAEYSQVRAEGKPIRKTGGVATGPIALMQMVNEAGRGIRQGGSRRSAIWAGLNWSHPDIQKFIELKNWNPEVRALKEKDFNFPATMDGTNISVGLDDKFFKAYGDDKHILHSQAHQVYWSTVKQMLKTAEPGFSINLGKDSKEILRNAPVTEDTYVLTQSGYQRVGDIVNEPIVIWTGVQWANTVFKRTGVNVPIVKVTMTGGREITCDPSHQFILSNGDRKEAGELNSGANLLVSLLSPTISKKSSKSYSLGYIYGDGTFHKKYPRAEVTFCTDASKECVVGFNPSLFTSVNDSDSRGFVRAYTKNDNLFASRDKAVFPHDVFSWTTGEQASFIAGLFDANGNYFEEQNRVRVASKHKELLVGVRRLLEQLGILSGISTAGISTYGENQGYMLTIQTMYVTRFSEIIPTIRLKIKPCDSYRKAQIKVISVEDAGYADVFCCDVKRVEHSFMAEGIIISNCTEVTSDADSDICNLGSINMALIESLEQLDEVVECATAFLLAGTVYSDVPYAKIDLVRTQNRRLGLGLMGIHEWLLKRNYKYESNEELEKYLKVYVRSDEYAEKYAKKWDLSVPVKTRAIAPTGTIGIVAETTTGIEPIFCVAYKRRYLKGSVWNYQYVIDPTAKRLIDSGIAPESIEDAYVLAENVERRVAFQAWIQKYVDHSISSTINLPEWGSALNNAGHVQSFGKMLMKYLPELRGITVYPDGARGGQPLTPVKYQTAIKHVGEIFFENADICDLTKGGSCG